MTSEDEEVLLRCVTAIADQDAIDWSSVPAGLADVAPALRVLDAVANYHLDLQKHPSATPPDSGAAATAARQWKHLRLLERVGGGAFGEVFRAVDTTLDREVALKLLAPRSRPASSGFVHEGRLLARLHHVNVVTVYGADEVDGAAGIWMEFVRGRSLRDIVQQEGPFSVAETWGVGDALCRALAAVHAVGLLHRDIKPSNVMREAGGRIVLTDFGTGCAIPEANDLEGWRAEGTPLYMAPELLQGGAPSVQSDLYSLGVLLFYLLTGDHPVRGRSVEDIADAHRRRERRPLLGLRPDVPQAFVDVIERATDPTPQNRFSSAADMQRALTHGLSSDHFAAHTAPRPAARVRWWQVSRLQALVLAAAVVAAVVLGMSIQRRADPTVAVLPFVGSSYFGQGVSQDVSTEISRIPGMRVVSGASVARFADSRDPAEVVGKALGVRHLVTGQLEMVDNRMKLSVRLVDCSTSKVLWSDTFEGANADVFEFQHRIARSVAGTLNRTAAVQVAQRLEDHRMSPDAYDAYLKGRGLLSKRTPESVGQAIVQLQRAVAVEPNAAAIRATLALAYQVAGTLEVLPYTQASSAAESEARQAQQLDPSLPESYAILGLVLHFKLRWQEAEQAYRAALDLNPNQPSPHHWLALLLAARGRAAEARHEVDIARDIDPLAVAIGMARGVILTMSGSPVEAVRQLQNVIDVEPEYARAHSALSEAYAAMGRWDLADVALTRAEQLSPERMELIPQRAYLLASTGRQAEARSLIEPLEEGGSRVSAYELATAYAALGDADKALAALRTARDRNDDLVVYARVDPKLKSLRSDPRYGALLRELGLLD